MNLLQSSSGRIVLFTSLYASEGAPIGFIWWAIPTLLRLQGISIEKITGLTATLVLFWTFKFLWAPFVDSLRSPRWGFREWIITSQVLMGVSLLPLFWIDPSGDFGWLTLFLMLHALSATTQDVAVDALAINTAPASQRGTINGCMQAGMLLGRSLFGGGALLVATQWGWRWLILALILSIWSSLVLLLFTRENIHPEPHSSRAFRARFSRFGTLLRPALRRKSTWLAITFALLSAAAFEATGALAGPFLVDHGVDQETVGFFFGVPVVIATVLGGIAGGRISDRFSRRNSIGLFLTGFVTMILLLAWVESFYSSAASPGILLAILTGMYLFIGLFTSSSYALFMDLTDPRLGGTQFSTFMAATNGCESWSTWAGGRIAAQAGYPSCFVFMSVVSLLSLPLLAGLGRKSESAVPSV